MPEDFVHLHVHSEFSLLDGLGRVEKLVERAQRLGQPALALTDHGTMHGVIPFFRACKGAGIRPVIGVEAYLTRHGRPMAGRDPVQDKDRHHLLLLAQNQTGYKNLLKICSDAQMSGYYYRPRIDAEYLAAHSEGLICTTGCLAAEVPSLLSPENSKQQPKLALQRLQWYVDVFGKERFFIELQEHDIPALREVNKTLLEWSARHDIGLIVTNDVHYVEPEDAKYHDVLLCVQTGASIQQQDRMRMGGGSYYLKSGQEMRDVFRPLADLPDSAFTNTLRIAEMCQVNLEDKSFHLPGTHVPEGHTYETYLRQLTEQGLIWRYGSRADDPEVQARTEHELKIIHQMGFDVYFLIVADLCRYARSRNIWYNVRGSGAGSIVAHAVGITGIDPISNNLVFERFLNPGRVSMPDFDLDFPDDQREEMIRYTIDKYGAEHVAQIVSFGRMKARAAVRDVARAMEIPLEEVDRIAKLIPAIPGKPVTIEQCLGRDPQKPELAVPELIEVYESQESMRELLDTAGALDGVARHASTHAAAVIVTDQPLTEYLPVMRPQKAVITEAVTQFEFPICESIGLLKVDFLGLSTLSVMREAAKLIRERHGVEYTLDTIPLDEPVSYELLSSGEVSGVFQVEGAGLRRVLVEMQPREFNHIVAAISLYRPGPMDFIPEYIAVMHGKKEAEYVHPALEPILGETYGVCVSGDAIVMDARTGERFRLDDIRHVKNLVVWGVDQNRQLAKGRVTHWIDSGFKAVSRIVLSNGASVKVTPDHRLLTEQGWRPVQELGIGDRVAVPYLLDRSAEAVPTASGNVAVLVHGTAASRCVPVGPSLVNDASPAGTVAWQEIVFVEPVGTEHVYDLTVEGVHSFVANNIIVHNCVYQEQVIKLLTDIAGYTASEADNVRRAISKKSEKTLIQHREIFAKGSAEKSRLKRADSDAIWDALLGFARYGFNRCLTGDTEVLDAVTGHAVRIEDLYTGAARIDATVTCDIDRLKLKSGGVSAVLYNGVKPVFRLITALGKQIEATANHPFYTFDGWRLLEQLRPGDRLAVPRRLPVEGSVEWPDHEVIALGHLIAEGNLCHPHSVDYYAQDKMCLADYVQAAEAFDNVECRVSLHKATHSVYARRIDRNRETGIVPWAKSLAIWGKNARTKELPTGVFALRNRQIALLLGRLWAGDGHIGWRPRGAVSAYYATSSEKLARQVQHLLLRLGVVSRRRKQVFPYKEGRVGYQVHVMGGEQLKNFARALYPFLLSEGQREICRGLLSDIPDLDKSSRDTVPVTIKELVRSAKASAGITWGQITKDCGVSESKFHPVHTPTKHGFRRDVIGRLADYYSSDALRVQAESDIYWDEIVSVDYVGEKPTYDLTIDGTHNFIANDILVHNSHAADYAVITVQTAYLKARYPLEYMAAMLHVERDNSEKVAFYITEARRMGIEVLPPDVNASALDFTVEQLPVDAPPPAGRDLRIGFRFPVPPGAAIRYGLVAVKNVGEGPVETIVAARQQGGPFKSLDDLCERVDLRRVGKKSLECLIKVGALDAYGERGQLLEAMDQMIGASRARHEADEVGQLSMFDLLGADGGGALTGFTSSLKLPTVEPLNPKQRLEMEKELLGVYVSSHPLHQMAVDLTGVITCTCGELDDTFVGKGVVLAGNIVRVNQITTKKGDRMAFVTLEDLQGQCDVTIFPRTWEDTKAIWQQDKIVVVRGKAEKRGDKLSVLCESVQDYVVRAVAADDGEASAPLRAAPVFADGNGLRQPVASFRPSRSIDEDSAYGDEPAAMADDLESPFMLEEPEWLREAPVAYGDRLSAIGDRSPVIGDQSAASGGQSAANGEQSIVASEISVGQSKPPAARNEPVSDHPSPLADHRSSREVRVTIQRTADVEKDKKLLSWVYDLLRGRPGRDRFCIVVRKNGGAMQLDFPNDTTEVTTALEQQLTRRLGAGSVEIRETVS